MHTCSSDLFNLLQLSARAESIVVEGVTSDGDLVPLVTPERGTGVTSSNLLAVDLEKNPSSNEADYGLCCLLEPVELVYIEVRPLHHSVKI